MRQPTTRIPPSLKAHLPVSLDERRASEREDLSERKQLGRDEAVGVRPCNPY